jgi:hypothetical protein
VCHRGGRCGFCTRSHSGGRGRWTRSAFCDRENRDPYARTHAYFAYPWLNLIDEYKFLVRPRIIGHGPTLYQSGLPSTRRLEVSAEPLRNGAVAMHYRRAR